MFGTKNVYTMVNGFRVRLKDPRQQDRNHVAEVDFETPLMHDLADEILPQMAADLFEEVNGEWQPKQEIIQASFAIQPDTQLLTVREHPDMDPLVKIAGVSIRKIKAQKGEANNLLLQFTASWTLGDYVAEAVGLIQRLRTGIYLTCEVQEPTLAEQPAEQQQELPAAEEDERPNQRKLITGRKGRKARGRRGDVDQSQPQADPEDAVDDEPQDAIAE